MNDPELPGLIDKVGQLFMIGIGGGSLSSGEKKFIRSNNIGFIILFSRNFSSIAQLTQLTSDIHSLTEIPPAIFIDQEGGPISRLGEDGSTVISHMGLAATGNKKNARRAGSIIGKEMRSLGIDGVFAPVLDVNSRRENPVIGIRSFSDDPDQVSEFATEFFLGLKKKKTIACGKHFPGHGHTTADSHLEIPESEIDLKFLSRINLPPFRKLINIGIQSIMTAHVSFPLLSDKISTFSTEITRDLLREKMDFRGVLFSDCLEMNAVKDNFTPKEIIEGIIRSSVDVVAVSHSMTFQKELIELLKLKIITREINTERIKESLERVLELKKKFKRRSFRKNKNICNLRKKIKLERKIARNSITLLKNDQGQIPLKADRSILMIDLKKISHTANAPDKIGINIIESVAGGFFHSYDYLLPEQKQMISEDEKRKILKSDHILIFDHTWSSRQDKERGSYIKDVFKLRKDSILICANSPYIADEYENAGTILLTYGSRKVQIEALFSILSGRSKPKGQLPVTISKKFPIGS